MPSPLCLPLPLPLSQRRPPLDPPRPPLPDLLHPLLPRQLEQDLHHPAIGRRVQALRHVLVHPLDNLHRRPLLRRARARALALALLRRRPAARRPRRPQHRQHLVLALLAVPDVLLHPARPVRHHGPVPGVRPPRELALHPLQAVQVHVQVLEDRCAVAQHVVTREHGVLLLQHQRHVVVRVPGRVDRAQRGPLDPERLPVLDPQLALVRRILVDLGMWGHPQEVFLPARVVRVPVRRDGLGDRGVLLLEHPLQGRDPRRLPVAVVDEQPVLSCANKIRIRPCAPSCQASGDKREADGLPCNVNFGPLAGQR